MSSYFIFLFFNLKFLWIEKYRKIKAVTFEMAFFFHLFIWKLHFVWKLTTNFFKKKKKSFNTSSPFFSPLPLSTFPHFHRFPLRSKMNLRRVKSLTAWEMYWNGARGLPLLSSLPTPRQVTPLRPCKRFRSITSKLCLEIIKKPLIKLRSCGDDFSSGCTNTQNT